MRTKHEKGETFDDALYRQCPEPIIELLWCTLRLHISFCARTVFGRVPIISH